MGWDWTSFDPENPAPWDWEYGARLWYPHGSLNTWLNLEWQGQEEAKPNLPTRAPYPAQSPEPKEQP